MENTTIKRTKSKTVPKKNKRKLDEYDADANKNGPNRKKSKYNKRGILNKLNALFESHRSSKKQNYELKKQVYHYKEGVNVYKKEANKWKSKYMTLYSQLHLITNNNINLFEESESAEMRNDVSNMRQIKINKNKLSPSPTPPPSQYFHKPKNKTNNNRKNSKRKTFNTNFDDRYYISVNCHVCEQYFDDICEYSEHLEEHYNDDQTKIWKQCDFGCNINPKKPLFNSAADFIAHIASHTKNYPYKCNIRVNGNKCKYNAGAKSNLKQHWKTHNYKSSETCSESDYQSSISESESTSGSESEIQTESNDNYDDNTKYIQFEKSYFVSVHCHVCKRHFDDINKYRAHIKQHYDNDSNKKWMKCDFGCTKQDSGMPVVLSSARNFITHIATHTGDKPFKCNVTVNGMRCMNQNGCKHALKMHWKSNHL